MRLNNKEIIEVLDEYINDVKKYRRKLAREKNKK